MTGTNGDLVLAMHGIVKTFGGVRALDGANLEVESGSIHGLVGQNGAGKSTLIKILAGIHRPDAGTIRIRELACHHLTPRQVEHLGDSFHSSRPIVSPDLHGRRSTVSGRRARHRSVEAFESPSDGTEGH